MNEVTFSSHAKSKMRQRSVSEESVRHVIENPEQSLDSGARKIFQSRYVDEAEAEPMLLRVVVEPRSHGMYVVTVYKTSRIGKYLREGNQQ